MFSCTDAAQGIPTTFSQNRLLRNTYHLLQNIVNGLNTTFFVHYKKTAGKRIQKGPGEAIILKQLINVIHLDSCSRKNQIVTLIERKNLPCVQ
jgi:hypothetical protein